MEQDSSSYPELKFLSEFAEIGKLRNRLPHWSQDRATCFITFRLGDSIPTKLLTEWRSEREEWLLTHAKPWSLETEMEYHKRFSMRRQWKVLRSSHWLSMDICGHVPPLLEGNGIGGLLAFSLEAESLG